MDLNLQPLAHVCHITSLPFEDGQRVASFLVNEPGAPEVMRYDLLESEIAKFTPKGQLVCSWVHPYKTRRSGDSAAKALKLTTETLFLTLADPAPEPSDENTRLMLFLALMLERKRVLRPRGKTADGARVRYEHSRSKQIFELPADELTPEFFVRVQEQLSVLVGVPKPKETPAVPGAAAPKS